ncbi:MAG: hypothetical protein K0R09_349 [Clostridiales bacterium]|jgi:peptidoglycan hydrolase CwlO-like protein|nr:hypothetical protein [Clostridiales bacterium]
MKKAVLAALILVMVMTLTSCGSNKEEVNTSIAPKINSNVNADTNKSIEVIEDTLESVQTSVDSLEDAVDINLDNL